VTRKKSAVSEAAKQEFSAHPPEFDCHAGLTRLLYTFVLCKGDQPLPFGNEAAGELTNRAPCILDQPLIPIED
jgi:hypothetical protein